MLRKSAQLFIAILVIACAVFANGSNAHAALWACDWGGALYSVNTGDASLSFIGNTGLSQLGALEFASNGTLYGFTEGYGASLYTINPNTGAATAVGALGTDFFFEGGLAFGSNGVAYGVNRNSNSVPYLFSIDLNTGAATTIGQIGQNHDINGLAWRGDGMLVGIDDNTTSLVTIDPVTASLSTLADLPFSVGAIGGMTTDIATGTNYFATGINADIWGNPGTNSLYSFDLFSGAYTKIGSFSGYIPAGVGPTGVSGLAGSPIPEPTTLGLLGVGLVGLAIKRRKSMRVR